MGSTALDSFLRLAIQISPSPIFDDRPLFGSVDIRGRRVWAYSNIPIGILPKFVSGQLFSSFWHEVTPAMGKQTR
jgi:hypothetical protein